MSINVTASDILNDRPELAHIHFIIASIAELLLELSIASIDFRDFDDDMAKFRENPDADDDEEDAAATGGGAGEGSDESDSDSDEEVCNHLNFLNKLI